MKLHLGCGKRDFGSDWISIDKAKYLHVKYHDITNLPFESNSVDLIYASHVLEYFDRVEAVNVLNEWNRVLKPNGILRIAVPNFETLTKLYYTFQLVTLDNLLGPLYGKMIINANETIYHKTCYDFISLGDLLVKCQFKNIKLYDWRKTEHAHIDDHSQAYFPHMDKENGILISLNVECKK